MFDTKQGLADFALQVNRKAKQREKIDLFFFEFRLL